jgi:hypothetical protein
MIRDALVRRSGGRVFYNVDMRLNRGVRSWEACRKRGGHGDPTVLRRGSHSLPLRVDFDSQGLLEHQHLDLEQ